MNVLVWNEFHGEQHREAVRRVYPDGIHNAIAAGLRRIRPDWHVATATLDEPDCGLDAARLDATDVLLYWGHARHAEVTDAAVERVRRRVLDGMGLVLLHSGLQSRIAQRLLGATGAVRWREIGEKERIWIVDPGHPLAAGLDPTFVIPHAEMYGEPADIPPPEATVAISWFQGGEVFRSLVVWRRGLGRIAYFRPGHEEYPVYHQRDVQAVLANAAAWAGPRLGCPVIRGNQPPLEPVRTEGDDGGETAEGDRGAASGEQR